MLQLIYQIDVWEYCVATSPAPQMDTGWNWCVICAKEAVAASWISMRLRTCEGFKCVCQDHVVPGNVPTQMSLAQANFSG